MCGLGNLYLPLLRGTWSSGKAPPTPHCCGCLTLGLGFTPSPALLGQFGKRVLTLQGKAGPRRLQDAAIILPRGCPSVPGPTTVGGGGTYMKKEDIL